jgi:hypothetical protein
MTKKCAGLFHAIGAGMTVKGRTGDSRNLQLHFFSPKILVLIFMADFSSSINDKASLNYPPFISERFTKGRSVSFGSIRAPGDIEFHCGRIRRTKPARQQRIRTYCSIEACELAGSRKRWRAPSICRRRQWKTRHPADDQARCDDFENNGVPIPWIYKTEDRLRQDANCSPGLAKTAPRATEESLAGWRALSKGHILPANTGGNANPRTQP